MGKNTGKRTFDSCISGSGGRNEGKSGKGIVDTGADSKDKLWGISGKRTKRVKQLESLFRKAKVPYEICPSMEEWQLCHLALVVPLGDAIREGKGNHLDAAGNQQLMKKTTRRIKRNLYLLQKKGVRIIPQKLKCLSYLPDSICTFALTKLFCSKIGEIYIYPHAHYAEQEMLYLHKTFYRHMRKL